MDNQELKKIPYLTVVFNNRLRSYEIPAFRGAVISRVPKELVLFHNHLDETFRFSYPLIQYKIINNKAAIVCIGDGTREVESFFTGGDIHLSIGDRKEVFGVENAWAREWILQTWSGQFTYSLHKWLPFNSTNYQKHSYLEGIVEQTQMLESILIGNLLSMSKGLDCFFDNQVSCKITSIYNSRLYTHKDIKFQGYDLVFKTNIYLPDYIGIGKGASMGFGIIKHINDNNKGKAYDRSK